MYLYFLNLSLTMKMLLNKTHIKEAKVMIKNFITSAKITYGMSFLSYNVHSSFHSTDDYEKWEALDNVSCFPFWLYLGINVKEKITRLK